MERGQLGEGRRALPHGRRALVGLLCRGRGAAPALLCLVALALRLSGLGDAALWVDESFTWFDYRHPLGQILGARLNVHPPAYGLLMHAWMPLGGESEYALRLPAALLSILAVPALWRLGVRLGGRPTGALAALLVAVAPLGLGFAREARMYGPLAAEAALVLLLAEGAARRPGPAGRAGLLGATIVALLTHYTAAAAWAAAALRTAPPLRPRPLLGWLGAQALVGAVALAWALQLWANRDAWGGLVWLPWTGRTRLGDMALDWITAMAGLPVGPNGLGEGGLDGQGLARLCLVALFAVALALGVLAALRADRRSLGLSALLLALGPAAAIAALEYARPGWHVRFVVVGLPAALLLAALGATAPRGRLWPLSAGLTAALVVGQLWGLALRTPPDRESWRAVAALLRREAGPGQVALGGVGSLVGYYLEPVLPVRQRPVAIGRPPEETAADLARAVEGATVIWLVPRTDPLMDPSDLVGTLLGRQTARREEREVGGIPLSRIELRPGARIGLGPALRPIDALFGQAIRLTGFASERGADGAAATIGLSLDLRVERPLAEDYKLFTHLLDAAGNTVAQRDVIVLDPLRRPTSQIEPGTRVRLELSIEGAPAALSSGRAVGVGFYQSQPPGARLPLVPPAPEDRLVLPLDA
ncbi:MAG TPA: glycosyltransferase family 39 protein [Chloroflexota bacterium]